MGNFNTALYYQEVFLSIQGESTDAGKPCVFVRLFGCNMKCSYCDQPQALRERRIISIKNLVNEIKRYEVPNVCITGGEPLLQWEVVYPLVLELTGIDYAVSIETNGCTPIDPDAYSKNFKYIMDVKCPSSGVSDKNIFENLMYLTPKDEVKFVICDFEDYGFAKKVLNKYPTSAKILFSPCFNSENKVVDSARDLVKWVLEDKFNRAFIQVQLHKILSVR